ncbi:hypothetical protein M758_8G154600 [Ceratodon purpureus]|uniref:OsmC-like protein n=1 Tax=Ceratodon purpureus TaxID=3225 RepID=A0A8T0GZF3_CERPU|nr:hypothetical protein KC19_8G158300 [Ceratodon purpureus]KAG0609065.1 hypothetical protein M758_8G154600 [Ceratodon purpureus]
MAAALVRPSVLLMPTLSAGLNSQLRRLRIGSSFLRVLSCSLHTVVAAEDPSEERYKHTITSGPHTFRGDLSESWGAGGTAPEPKDYAFAGLAMCSSMTIRLFAERKKWPLRRVTVTVKEVSSKELHGTIPDGLQVIVSLEGELTDAQKKRLIEISERCPVKQMMLGKMRDGISVHLAT